jgi:hypothetical protein
LETSFEEEKESKKKNLLSSLASDHKERDERSDLESSFQESSFEESSKNFDLEPSPVASHSRASLSNSLAPLSQTGQSLGGVKNVMPKKDALKDRVRRFPCCRPGVTFDSNHI